MNKIYVGIDIGGSKIAGVAFSSLNGKPKRNFIAHFSRTKKGFLEVLQRETYALIKNDRLIGIGLGLPGPVDYKRGMLIEETNLPFIEKWSFKKFFSRFRAPIRIDNDSRCFLRAEAILGIGRGYKNIVGISIGTGIGGGVIVNGEMYYGAHKSAGELGFMVIDGKKTFEQLGARRAFLKFGNRSRVIGVGVANLVNILDPDIVILGGGGGLSKHVNLQTVRTVANRHIILSMRGKIPIVKGKLGESAQAIGAALLFQK